MKRNTLREYHSRVCTTVDKNCAGGQLLGAYNKNRTTSWGDPRSGAQKEKDKLFLAAPVGILRGKRRLG